MSTKKKSTKPASSANRAAAALQSPSTAVAVVATGALTLPAGIKAVRNLQMPSLVMKEPGVQRVLEFTSQLMVSNVKAKEGEAPATVADVRDVETGEIFKFLVPAVVESTIIQSFGAPGDNAPSGEDRKDIKARQQLYDGVGIQGRVLAIRNAGKKAGKRHVDFEVIEVQLEAVEN